MKSATAAAEPLDEPPGLCIRFFGCEVGPGWRLANSVVTVLPSRMRAGGARQRYRAGIEARPATGIDRRAVAGRHLRRIEDVLDAERHARGEGRGGRRGRIARAAASACSGSRWAQARTTGSRSRMRSRQLCTTASAVSSPPSIRRARVPLSGDAVRRRAWLALHRIRGRPPSKQASPDAATGQPPHSRVGTQIAGARRAVGTGGPANRFAAVAGELTAGARRGAVRAHSGADAAVTKQQVTSTMMSPASSLNAKSPDARNNLAADHRRIAAADEARADRRRGGRSRPRHAGRRCARQSGTRRSRTPLPLLLIGAGIAWSLFAAAVDPASPSRRARRRRSRCRHGDGSSVSAAKRKSGRSPRSRPPPGASAWTMSARPRRRESTRSAKRRPTPPSSNASAGSRCRDEHKDEHRDEASREHGHGRSATTPSEIPKRGWKDILLRVYRGIGDDRILANAGAVTFFALLALFPGIAALVSVYGLFSDAGTIGKQLDTLSLILPGGAIEVIGGELTRLTGQGRQSWASASSFGLAGLAVERQWRHQGAVRRAQHRLRGEREARLHPAQRPQPDFHRRR